jgi:hypothetical protein
MQFFPNYLITLTCHLALTFVPPEVCDPYLSLSPDISIPPSCPVLYMDAATDPMCPSFPDSHVIMDSGEQRSISESPPKQPQSAYKTRPFDRMSKNIGGNVRRIFFINGTSGPLDFFEDTVRSITSVNK